jgi:hypothetical protein
MVQTQPVRQAHDLAGDVARGHRGDDRGGGS